jgi:NusA-like KH domain protein
MGVSFDVKTLQLISLFEKKTRARVKDCILTRDRTIFIVEKGNLFKIIKNKGNIQRLENVFKFKIKLVEFNSDITIFVKNFVHPIRPESIIKENNIVFIKGSDTKSKGLLIGRDSRNLILLKNVVKKFFNIEDIKVV